MNTSQTTIKTERLYLQGITLDYVEDVFKEFTPEIATYTYPKSAEKIEETEEFIKKSIRKNKEGINLQMVILSKDKKEFLGLVGLHHLDQKTPELGIWLKKSAHGHRYGKEVIVALKKWADQNLDYDYLLYTVDINNKPSKKIAEFFTNKVAREYEEMSMSGRKLHILEYRIYPE